jgi:hypothetical protein
MNWVSIRLKRGFDSDSRHGHEGVNMNKFTYLAVACCVLVLAVPASKGQLTASGTAVGAPSGPNWDYTVTLTNSSSSTDSLGTFWFMWVPGEDFAPHAPISETAPSGWDVNAVTHGGATDGYAIRYEATSAANDLAPGQSLVFGFVSQDSPSVFAGDSPFYPTTPIGTSFVYQGGPFSGSSDQFVVAFASVPEPSSIVLGLLGTAASFAYLHVRRKRMQRTIA